MVQWKHCWCIFEWTKEIAYTCYQKKKPISINIKILKLKLSITDVHVRNQITKVLFHQPFIMGDFSIGLGCNDLGTRSVGHKFCYRGVYIAKFVFIGSLYSKSHLGVQTWTKFSILFIFLLYTPLTSVFNSRSHYQLIHVEYSDYENENEKIDDKLSVPNDVSNITNI